jgi:hypothetical protein
MRTSPLVGRWADGYSSHRNRNRPRAHSFRARRSSAAPSRAEKKRRRSAAASSSWIHCWDTTTTSQSAGPGGVVSNSSFSVTTQGTDTASGLPFGYNYTSAEQTLTVMSAPVPARGPWWLLVLVCFLAGAALVATRTFAFEGLYRTVDSAARRALESEGEPKPKGRGAKRIRPPDQRKRPRPNRPRALSKSWSTRPGSNRRPPRWQRGALPLSYSCSGDAVSDPGAGASSPLPRQVRDPTRAFGSSRGR